MLQTIKLQQSDIDQAITKCTTQAQFINHIFSLAYPGVWDELSQVRGYPICNKQTWKYICQKAQEFDEKKDLKSMPGGAWMNYGFSTVNSEGLEFMEVKQAPYNLDDKLVTDVVESELELAQ